ncbi:curlin subunit CsgB [Vibrio nomapromontoriensis]|uniref:curlin subunit CsgB n=1 Tax=Vibrio nomapromontoriensis TaxID=2910246 RepID=UPI003D0BF317
MYTMERLWSYFIEALKMAVFCVFTLFFSSVANASISFDLNGEFGDFGNGISNSDLMEFDELSVATSSSGYSNYAKVVVSNSQYNQSIIEQEGGGYRSNGAVIIQSDTMNSQASIRQDGQANLAMVKQSGHDNSANIKQHGVGHHGLVVQDGEYNIAILNQYSTAYSSYSGSDISLNQTNDNNIAFIVDGGGSNYGVNQDGGDQILIVGASNMGIYVNQTTP